MLFELSIDFHKNFLVVQSTYVYGEIMLNFKCCDSLKVNLEFQRTLLNNSFLCQYIAWEYKNFCCYDSVEILFPLKLAHYFLFLFLVESKSWANYINKQRRQLSTEQFHSYKWRFLWMTNNYWIRIIIF